MEVGQKLTGAASMCPSLVTVLKQKSTERGCVREVEPPGPISQGKAPAHQEDDAPGKFPEKETPFKI